MMEEAHKNKREENGGSRLRWLKILGLLALGLQAQVAGRAGRKAAQNSSSGHETSLRLRPLQRVVRRHLPHPSALAAP